MISAQEFAFACMTFLTLVPLGFLMPCSNCCICSFLNDPFTTNTIANYTQVSGSWSISSGRLRTSSSTALIVCNADGPDTAGGVYARIFGVVGDVHRVVANYVDANNYLWVEIDRVSSSLVTLSLYDRTSGTDTLIDSISRSAGYSGTFETPVRVCWGEGFASVMWSSSANEYARGAYTAKTGGLKSGLGVDTLVGSEMSFDDWQMFVPQNNADGSPISTCQECRTCSPCSDIEPLEIQAVISGVLAGTGTAACANCLALNATWIFDHDNNFKCYYRKTGSCGAMRIRIERRWGLFGVGPPTAWLVFDLGFANALLREIQLPSPQFVCAGLEETVSGGWTNVTKDFFTGVVCTVPGMVVEVSIAA